MRRKREQASHLGPSRCQGLPNACGERHTNKLRMLFTAVVASRMDYAAIVWHKPLKQHKPPPSTTTAKIAKERDESHAENFLHCSDVCATNRNIPTTNAPPSACEILISAIDKIESLANNKEHAHLLLLSKFLTLLHKLHQIEIT